MGLASHQCEREQPGGSGRRTDTAVLSAEHLAGDTSTLDLLAPVLGRIGTVLDVASGRAIAQAAIERLDASDPELEAARVGRNVAGERDLRSTIRKHVDNLAVCGRDDMNELVSPVEPVYVRRRTRDLLVTSHIWYISLTPKPSL